MKLIIPYDYEKYIDEVDLEYRGEYKQVKTYLLSNHPRIKECKSTGWVTPEEWEIGRWYEVITPIITLYYNNCLIYPGRFYRYSSACDTMTIEQYINPILTPVV